MDIKCPNCGETVEIHVPDPTPLPQKSESLWSHTKKTRCPECLQWIDESVTVYPPTAKKTVRILTEEENDEEFQ